MSVPEGLGVVPIPGVGVMLGGAPVPIPGVGAMPVPGAAPVPIPGDGAVKVPPPPIPGKERVHLHGTLWAIRLRLTEGNRRNGS